MDPLKIYFLLKIGIFHCYVSLPEGNQFLSLVSSFHDMKKRPPFEDWNLRVQWFTPRARKEGLSSRPFLVINNPLKEGLSSWRGVKKLHWKRAYDPSSPFISGLYRGYISILTSWGPSGIFIVPPFTQDLLPTTLPTTKTQLLAPPYLIGKKNITSQGRCGKVHRKRSTTSPQIPSL